MKQVRQLHNKNKNISRICLVSFPIDLAFHIPISNLVGIISSIAETSVVFGSYDPIPCKNNNINFFYIIYYAREASKIKKIFRYAILQIQIAYKLILLRDSFDHILIFIECGPLFLTILSKLLHKNIYWMLPAKISIFSKNLFSKTEEIISRICYNLSTKIIIYSPYLINDWHLEAYRYKILIAHRHFLDFETFTVTTPFPDRPPLIGYIGRLSREKGVQHFARSLSAIFADREGLCALIGGDGKLKESIASSLQEEGIAARVDLPGWISHDNLPGYLNQLRLLVLPSYTEGLPNIMLEAMACGTPVLATPVGAVPDVIIDGKTGFIMKNNSPECIAENVARVLEHPDLERIAERGKRFVGENFTFERAVERWKEVFEEI
jgi:glycosyltransferase involved in cell wall biosynthesis